MGVKTRRPYRLSDDDFDTFCWVDMKQFLAGPNSQPNRPDHLVANFNSKAEDFHDKLDEYREARQIRNNSTSAFVNAVDEIRKKLRWMRMALPTLTPGSEEIIEPFGLDKDIPADNDEMKNYADAVFAHWLTVRTDPLYAPFVGNINALASLFAAYESAQVTQNSAQEEASLLQNEKEEIRLELEDMLKSLMDWYRIYYKDYEDEYWTQTPWGKASQEGSGAPPGIPQNLAAAIEGEDVRLSWSAVEGADGYYLVHTEHPPLFLRLYEGENTEYVHLNPPGGTHYYQVRARKNETYGEYCEQIQVVVVGVAPGAPKNLQLTYDGSYVRASWESPETGVPQYYRLYMATAPTGGAAPSKPGEPYQDEIITLGIGVFPPAPGTTVYIWITAYADGMEGEACGPATIDIV